MPDHEDNRNTIVTDTPAEVESTNRGNDSTADATMQEAQAHDEIEDHKATETPTVNLIEQAANEAATITSENFHGGTKTIAYSAGIEVDNVSQESSATTIGGINDQNETENELALASSHKVEVEEKNTDVLDTSQTSVVPQEESDNLNVNADGAEQKILIAAMKPDAIRSRLARDTDNEHPPTSDEDSYGWNSVHLEEEVHRKESYTSSSRSITAPEREICVNADMPSSLTDDHGFSDPFDSASGLDESLEGDLEAIYGLLRDEISNHNPNFHDSNLVDDFHQVNGMPTGLHDTGIPALESAAATQTNAENDSINDPSFDAGNDISRVEGNCDHEIHAQQGHSTVSEQKESNSTSRVSFAAQPSYFLDPIPAKETPKQNSTRNSSNNHTSHKKLRSTQRQHSEQHIAARGDEEERADESDRRSKHSSRKSSSQRHHSDRDNARRRDEDEQAVENDRRSMHASRKSSTNTKRRSSSQRSPHRRSNSGRRRQSRSRQSRHRHRQDCKSDRNGRDYQEDGMVALDEVNLHDSSSSSEEDIAEDQFDDEYEAEARGRGTRKHRSSKKNRMKSGCRSSSPTRVHSEYDRSSSFKPSKSSRHDNKRQSHGRSLSIGEIETRQGMRSHSSSEARQMQGKRQLQDLESPKRISNKKQKRRREKTRIRNRGFICCGILFCLLSTVGVLSFLLMRGNFKEDEPLAPTEQSPAVLSAPTTEQCRAISQGVRTTSDQTESSASRLKQFQIRMEVELDGKKSESDAPFMPILESALQAVVMPVLAGCEPVTLRRYRRMMGPPLESRRRINERLPHYVISNGSVVDAQFDLFPVALQSRQQFRYPVKVLIDLWVQEEVDDGLLSNKVRKAFDDFMGSPGIPEDFPLAASTVLSVEPIRAAQDSKEGTPFPTIQPSSRPSQAPTLASSTSPTIHDSSGPSFSPSSLPSLRPTGGPSPEPSKTPTLMPSLNPTKYPTRIPTLNPTRSPTAAPVTSSPTRAPVPINQAIDVIIVGAGAAGLSAAYHLHREGVSVVVLEASNVIGGRVKKDSTWDLDLDLGAEWLDYATSDFSDGNDMLSAILDRAVNKQIIREPNLANYWSGSTMRYDPPGSTSTDFRWVDSTWWDFLDEELMSNLPANTVILNSVVKTIDYGYQKPIVFCEDGRTYEGSYVIVTASMKVLQDGMISFVPSLPSRYQEAIDDIKMGSGIKVFLEFTEKFFPDIFSLDPDTETYNFDNCESSSHGVRYFYNPTYAQTSTKHIMGMFAYADIADLYIGQPHDTIIQSILGLLDQIFNGKASATFVKGVVQDWSSEPYIRAAYTNVAPNGAVDRLRSPIDDKVFFAGESVFSKDSDWGFVQGAALCGEDVAEDIIDAINGR